MVNKELIRDILKTYELPEKLEDKLFRITCTNIEEQNISSFDKMYRYIGYLVEQFKVPYNERNSLKLDSILNGRPISEIYGVEDSSLNEIIEPNKQITLTSALLQQILNDFDNDTQSFIKELFKSNNNQLELDSNTFSNSLKYFKSKLNFIFQKFGGTKGIDILKLRPIIDLRFDPFLIQFGRRKYNGNPLNYFEEHKQFYSGMTRNQLAKFDSGLYCSLRKSGQLEKGIPIIANRLSESEIKQILDSHEISKGIPFKAEKITNFDHHTIRKYWREYGLEIFSKIDHEKVVSSYDLYKGIASKAAKFLRCSTTTVLIHWRQEGLFIREPKHQKDIEYDYSYYEPLKEKRRREILPLYEEFNGNATRASNNSPYCYGTICNYWKEAGLIPRGHKEQRTFRKMGPRLSQQEIQKIVDTFKENRGNVSKTARDTKFSKQTVAKYCKKTNGG